MTLVKQSKIEIPYDFIPSSMVLARDFIGYPEAPLQVYYLISATWHRLWLASLRDLECFIAGPLCESTGRSGNFLSHQINSFSSEWSLLPKMFHSHVGTVYGDCLIISYTWFLSKKLEWQSSSKFQQVSYPCWWPYLSCKWPWPSWQYPWVIQSMRKVSS